MALITEGMDYLGVPVSLTFTEAGAQFVNISILDDDLVERPEDIQLLITSSTPGRILIDPSSAKVRIIDNDGEGEPRWYYIISLCIIKCFCLVAQFQFSLAYHNVSEDSGTVSICLELINGTLTKDIVIEVMVANNSGMIGCK